MLQKVLQEALEKQKILKSLDEIIIEIPKNASNGDYSSNIAMQLSKELNKNQREIALTLK